MAKYEERVIRGLTIRSDLTEKEIAKAAEERWSKGKGHSEEAFVDLWDELPPERKAGFIKGAEGSLQEEDVKPRADETRVELLERMDHNEELRAKFIQRRARSAFASKLPLTTEERLTGKFNEAGMRDVRIRQEREAAEKRAKEAEKDAALDRENARRARQNLPRLKSYEEMPRGGEGGGLDPERFVRSVEPGEKPDKK